MSRQWAFTALALSGLLLSACSPAKPASTVRVGSVVRIGPYTQEFAGPVPANAAQAAVVEGFREGEVLWGKSLNAGHLVSPVRDYVTGQALTHLNSAMKAGKARGLVEAGVDRLFMTHVTAITGRSAVVTTCDDGSRFKEQNPRTGEVDRSFLPTPAQAYLSETWRMVQRSGHWAITALSTASLPSRSAEPCQPGITGYGPSRPDVAVLLGKMRATLRAASSVHISGAIQQGGKTVAVDLAVNRSGEISGQISQDKTVVTVLATHGHTYLKITPGFLQLAHLPGTVCSRFCGKYLEYPAAQARELLAHLSMASLTSSMANTPARKVKLLGAVTSAGQLAWLLQDPQGNSEYVAAHGKPYVLRVVGAPSNPASVSVTQWNAVRIPGIPRASQVVQPSQLAG